MVTISKPVMALDRIEEDIELTLNTLGTGYMDSVAYDTAWIARLSARFPGQGFDEAIVWLRQHQHQDGSWGTEYTHFHDRFISTLAAVIALKTVGREPRDKRRISQGQSFLWHNYTRLRQDANETIAFPVLAAALIDQATAAGLDVPTDLYYDTVTVHKKLSKLAAASSAWRNHTICFSLEVVPKEFMPDEIDFLEANGSVGTSPSATASVLLHTRHLNTEAYNFLQQVMAQQADGGAPNVLPIDTFEISWSLQRLFLAGAIKPDHPAVQRCLAQLWNAWTAEKGIGASSYASIPNLDDTSTSFTVLKWGGYPVSPDVFALYERDDHFICFPDEADPSLSAHIRMLLALQQLDPDPRFEAWTEKIVSLIHRLQFKGNFWFDKWHISPYYVASTAIYALQGIPQGRGSAQSAVKWMQNTQRTDGGWGYHRQSTAEETAYCLQALLFWDRNVSRVEPNQLKAAASFLNARLHDEHFPALWIGKCLYTPSNVVKSTILAALHSYVQGDTL